MGKKKTVIPQDAVENVNDDTMSLDERNRRSGVSSKVVVLFEVKPKTEDAAATWRNQINHRGCQKKGHEALFEHYHSSVVTIIREYTADDRKEAPDDSNRFLRIK